MARSFAASLVGQSFVAACLPLVAACWIAAPRAACAQLPSNQLFAVSPPGGQQGTTIDVAITSGADQEGVRELRFSHPGITAVQKTAELMLLQTEPDPIAGQFAVSIAADVPPGVYDVRSVGTFGISNPRSFVVGDRPEVKEPGGNATRETAIAVELNSIVNGTADGTAADWYKFIAPAGQRVLIDCWAQRIDSRMDGTLVLYDATGRELARSRDAVRLDPFLDFAVPADGEYLLKVHDFVYAGGADYFYRLAIGTGPYIDYILPPAGLPGATSEFTIYGRNLPGGTPAEGVEVDGRPLERLVVQITLPAAEPGERDPPAGLVKPEDSLLDGVEYRLHTDLGASNPFFLGFATAPVTIEQEPNDEPALAQQIVVPCEYAGQFGPPGDFDWVTFEAKQGEVYWMEVFSQRLGVPTDPVVLVQRVARNEQGEEQVSDVQEIDDDGTNIGGVTFNTATSDPLARFQAPADGTYRILIRDLHYDATGDPRHLYRLSIRKEQPDFRLVAVAPYPAIGKTEARPWNPLLRRGGTGNIDVLVFRRDGFAGPIEITVEDLPPGITCPGAMIGPGLNSAPLVFKAADDAAAWAGPVRIVGRAKIGDAELTRAARPGSVLFAAPANMPAQARMARSLALAVTDLEMAPFLLDLGESKTWDMSRAGKLQIPVKVTRRNEIKAPLTCVPLGLPPEVAPTALALDGNTNEANFELQINPGAPLGSFTIMLQVQTTASYRRNVAAAEAAAKAKEEADKLAAELTSASEAAAAAKQAADTAAAEAEAALQAANAAKEAATEAATQAAEAAKTAADNAAAAKTAADADPNNQDLKTALEAADKAAAEAAEAAKAAEEARLTAETTAAEAAEKAKAAAEAKAAADTAATEAAANAQAAANLKAAAEKKAADTATAANPADVALFVPSTAATIRIVPAPITMEAAAPPSALKQGGQVELPVKINRLFGFAEAVPLEVVVPGGVAGLTAAAVSVPGDQSEGKLVISAAADATVGTHNLTIKATAPFNGQNLPVEQVVPVVVEAAQATN